LTNKHTPPPLIPTLSQRWLGQSRALACCVATRVHPLSHNAPLCSINSS